MRFWEAMKALDEGKSVRCKAWPPQCYMHSSQENECPFMGLLLWGDNLNGWELYEEPEPTLSFAEVVKGLKEGKRFKRKFWNGTYLQSDQIRIFRETDGGNSMVYSLEHEDFEATDWIEVKQ